jgi:hypothetical protein
MEYPRGTLYCEFTPDIFGEMMIKGDTIKHDDVNADWQFQMIQSSVDVYVDCHVGTSFDVDFDALSRDGCYDDDQLYCVWETPDVGQLMERLEQALRDGYGI